MAQSLQRALAQLESNVKLEVFLQTSFVLLKILHNIISNPDDEKYRRIRRESKLLGQSGAEDVLREVGFQEQGDFLVCAMEGDALKALVEAIRCIFQYRRRYNELSAWEIPTGWLTFNERVGKGKFGEVYRGSWDLEPVAIKTLRPKCEDYAVDQFKREANIMRQCKHTNVLSLRAVCLFVEPSYLVLDLMRCCYLDLLREGALGERQHLDDITQVAAGLEYLHHINILHCDIAARNVLVDFHNVLKISDFGMARFDQTAECNAALQPGVFPTRWTAPEVFTHGLLSKHSDVWSFGVTFYEFVTAGAVPYAQFTNKETKQKVLEGYRLEQPGDCLDRFYEIMMKCWNGKPKARPTVTEISQSLLTFKADRAETMRPKFNLSQLSVESSDSISSLTEGQDFVSGSVSPSPSFDDRSRRNSGLTLRKTRAKSRGSMASVKVEKLLCVYTMLVSPFYSQVVLRVKSKQRASDVLAMVLKKIDKEKASPSMFALVEVFDAEGLETKSMSRYLTDKEQPLIVRREWTRRGRFFLFNRVGNSSEALLDALNGYLQQSDNAAKMQYKTRGYLIKFDENVGGTKGRNVSRNWTRYWTVLDGSTMLFYKDEEDEEGEPLIHLSVKNGCVEPAADYVKKKSVLRLTTENGDQYWLHASNKDDMYRWVEAIHSVRHDSASIILEKFGSGEVLKSGFLNVTCQDSEQGSSSEPIGRNWFVLKDQHLSYFQQGERVVAVDFNKCVKVIVVTPNIVKDFDEKKMSTSSLLTFGIDVVLGDCTFHMKPDTPGEQEEWVTSFEKALTPIGKADVISLVEPEDVFEGGESALSHSPGSDNYVKFRRVEGLPSLPRLSEETDDSTRSVATSPAGGVDIDSTKSTDASTNDNTAMLEVKEVSKSASSDSVIVKLQRSFSQRKGGGYSVHDKLIKEGLDESVVYETTSLSNNKLLQPSGDQVSSLPDIDELPPPPKDLFIPSEADLSVPLDDLPPPPPPPPDFDELPPSLPTKSWKDASDFESLAPLVDRETKPRHRVHTADSSLCAGGHHDNSEYVRMDHVRRSETLSSHHPRQSSDEYIRMHRVLLNGTGAHGPVPDDPNYVRMAALPGSQPIEINSGNYVRMASSRVPLASAGYRYVTKKTSPLLGRRNVPPYAHERQDSLDGGETGGVLLYPPASPARTPSPNTSPKLVRDQDHRDGPSSLGSTSSSSAPSTPQPFATDDPSKMSKMPKRDLFSSPRRTIGDACSKGNSPLPSPGVRDLPAAAGVGYTRANTFVRQASSPGVYAQGGSYGQGQTRTMSPPRRESMSSVSSDQYTWERSDSLLSRSSSGSQRSQSSVHGIAKAQPLPAGWKSNSGSDGRIYYYNGETKQRTWHISEVWASVNTSDYTLTSMGPGWQAVLTPDGRTYYYHKGTRQTSWNIVDTWKQ